MGNSAIGTIPHNIMFCPQKLYPDTISNNLTDMEETAGHLSMDHIKLHQ
jgi:hypothetical protein